MSPAVPVIAAALAAVQALCATAVSAKSDDLASAKAVGIYKVAAVRISGLRDFIFPPSLTAPGPLENMLCIYSSEAGRYTVTASGSGPSGSFSLRSAGFQVSYYVNWFDQAQGGSAVALSPRQPSPVLQGADRQHETCNGSANARLTIGLDAAAFAAASPGVYTDTLTLLVSPD